MSYLGGTIVGVSTFEGIASIIIGDYTSSELYGGSSCFDNVRLINRKLSDAEFDALVLGETPLWTPETLMLATFDDSDLNAGNITGLTSPVTGYELFRKTEDELSFIKIADLPSTASSYVDITALPNVTYIYDLIATNEDERSNPIEGSITTNFYGIYLIDPITYKTYIFDLNLGFDTLNSEMAYQRYDGYNKFSGHSFGKRNFITGSISAIVDEYTTSNQFTQTADFVKELQDFINNGEYKILKTRKGEIFKVHTMNFSSQVLNSAITAQPYSISFNFEQIGEV